MTTKIEQHKASTYHAAGSAVIEAPAECVYAIIADYSHGHALILPKPYFISLQVEQGGFGDGTIISYEIKVAGKRQTFRAAIAEPEPGRVLVETNLGEGGATTTFNIESVDDRDERCNVTITTDGVTQRGGALGSIERWLTGLYLQRIYKKELGLLQALAKERC